MRNSFKRASLTPLQERCFTIFQNGVFAILKNRKTFSSSLVVFRSVSSSEAGGKSFLKL
jgi:hypothetical protein